MDELKKIQQIEARIEDALWACVRDGNREKELAAYQSLKVELEEMDGITGEDQKEYDRVYSYCLMRIDEALVNLDDEEEAEERAREALLIAERSGNEVQIARCRLALGIRLLSNGNLPDAEEQWRQVIEVTTDSDDEDMQQVLGWTLIVRGHVLNGKSLYNQALVVALEAEERLEAIGNYAGVAQANRILMAIYRNLGDSDSVDRCQEKAERYQKLAESESR